MEADLTTRGGVDRPGRLSEGHPPEPEHDDRTERLLHAYIREHLFMKPSEHADLVARFIALAERKGFTLGKIFTEKLETVPEAFTALVQAVVDDEAAAIAVPTLHHLSVLGPPGDVRESLERVVRVPVLVAGAHP